MLLLMFNIYHTSICYHHQVLQVLHRNLRLPQVFFCFKYQDLGSRMVLLFKFNMDNQIQVILFHLSQFHQMYSKQVISVKDYSFLGFQAKH